MPTDLAVERGAAGVTATLARFITGASVLSAPPEVRTLASEALIDTVGVIVAGRRTRTFETLLETVRPELGTGAATVLPIRCLTNARLAALLNGTAGHALDYDDVTYAVYGHPSVVLFPALLAAAEARGASGRDVLDAYAIGLATLYAVAEGVGVVEHYLHGWHATATLGVLGATAAVARVLRLDAAATGHALAIAASMSAGSRQNFGTMTKPLHAGLAASNAVLAASLGASGFTGHAAQLEGPLGFLRMYSGAPDVHRVLDAVRDRPWQFLDDPPTMKRYPCCFNAHRVAEAALRLAAREDVAAEAVVSATITLEPEGAAPLIGHLPTTGLEGKFSAEYVVASALIDGTLGLGAFSDAATQRSAPQALMRRMTVRESARPPLGTPDWHQSYAVVELELRDGRTVAERADLPLAAWTSTTDGALERKFRDCIAASATTWDADVLLEHLRDVAAQPLLRFELDI